MDENASKRLKLTQSVQKCLKVFESDSNRLKMKVFESEVSLVRNLFKIEAETRTKCGWCSKKFATSKLKIGPKSGLFNLSGKKLKNAQKNVLPYSLRLPNALLDETFFGEQW